jgi:hypothetical protein
MLEQLLHYVIAAVIITRIFSNLRRYEECVPKFLWF